MMTMAVKTARAGPGEELNDNRAIGHPIQELIENISLQIVKEMAELWAYRPLPNPPHPPTTNHHHLKRMA